jgi:signal transduction histidine kinase/ActR/RegA family two-component response regulator
MPEVHEPAGCGSSMTNSETTRPWFEKGESSGGRLIMLEGPGAGQRFRIDRELVLGRSPDIDGVIADPGVSRRHARIALGDDGRYFVEDLDSKNGTRVNGIPTKHAVLTFGDRVHLGANIVLLFTEVDPLEQELQQRQRLETLGRMSVGITHDLNNMLGAIIGSAEYLEHAHDMPELDAERTQECLTDIKLAAQQACQLANSVLAFARDQGQSLGLIDIEQLCRDAARLVRHMLRRNVHIELALQPGLLVRGSQAGLLQALMSLCLTSGERMEQGGRLRISSSLERSDPKHGAHVVVKIDDSAEALDQADLDHAFDPFYTGKARGKYGLGLSGVKTIIAEHGGQVQLTRGRDRGNQALVILPAAATVAEVDASPTSAPTARPVNALPRVLVVDDEPLARRSVTRVLEQLGYDVAQAADGPEALKLLRDGQRPDVVLLDLDMPGLNGEETYRILRNMDASIPVVIGSGRVGPDTDARMRALGVAAVLEKPYPREQLELSLENALASSPDFDRHTSSRLEYPEKKPGPT